MATRCCMAATCKATGPTIAHSLLAEPFSEQGQSEFRIPSQRDFPRELEWPPCGGQIPPRQHSSDWPFTPCARAAPAPATSPISNIHARTRLIVSSYHGMTFQNKRLDSVCGTVRRVRRDLGWIVCQLAQLRGDSDIGQAIPGPPSRFPAARSGRKMGGNKGSGGWRTPGERKIRSFLFLMQPIRLVNTTFLITKRKSMNWTHEVYGTYTPRAEQGLSVIRLPAEKE